MTVLLTATMTLGKWKVRCSGGCGILKMGVLVEWYNMNTRSTPQNLLTFMIIDSQNGNSDSYYMCVRVQNMLQVGMAMLESNH